MADIQGTGGEKAAVTVGGCVDDGELARAARLQRALLPPSPYSANGWTAAHHFQPAGLVGGDYIDLIPAGDRLYFVFADVSGKGVAASLVTAHLHGMFRSLIPFALPLEEIVARGSALLCSSTLPAQYATLVCGYLGPHGEVVLANAGHLPPLVISAGRQSSIVATGTPIGLFCDSAFGTTHLTLSREDTLLMYSDGLTEASDALGNDYGPERLHRVAVAAASLSLPDLLAAVTDDHRRFAGSVAAVDDLTLLAVRRQS